MSWSHGGSTRPHKIGLWLQLAPQRKRRSPVSLPSRPQLGASSWECGPLPPHPFPEQTPAQPFLVLSSERACPCPSSTPLAALSWASGPLVSGAPGGTHGPCVDLEGRGEGQSRRNFLTRRAKDGVLPDPRSHDCAHPPCSARVTCHSSFFPCPACSGLHAHPTQGGWEEAEMEITDQCNKDWGPSTSPDCPTLPHLP